jgi:predicted  nucleic acid-binding Zn-ribbon protein
MHPELEAVVKLWENVHLADRLQQERVACVDERRATAAAIQEARQQRDAAQAHLDEVRSEERRVMRKLDSYRKRVVTTRTMIDTGKAPDYRLAEQQLRACIEISDELETEALELMERRDEAEENLARCSAAFDQAEQAATQAVTRERERIPAIDRELEDLDLARAPLEADLALEHRNPFKVLRARKRSVVSRLKGGACSACNYGAPSQVVNEIAGEQRVHTCRNCGRFLLPESPA